MIGQISSFARHLLTCERATGALRNSDSSALGCTRYVSARVSQASGCAYS